MNKQIEEALCHSDNPFAQVVLTAKKTRSRTKLTEEACMVEFEAIARSIESRTLEPYQISSIHRFLTMTKHRTPGSS